MCWNNSQCGALWFVRKVELEEDFALDISEKNKKKSFPLAVLREEPLLQRGLLAHAHIPCPGRDPLEIRSHQVGTEISGSPTNSACCVHQCRVGHLHLGERRAQFEKSEQRTTNVAVALARTDTRRGQPEVVFWLFCRSGMHQSVSAHLLLTPITFRMRIIIRKIV